MYKVTDYTMNFHDVCEYLGISGVWTVVLLTVACVYMDTSDFTIDCQKYMYIQKLLV